MKTTGNTRIAQRYVKALTEVSSAANATDAVEKDLRALQHLLAESKDFQTFLTNPILSRQQQATAMAAVLEKIGAHKVTGQFIATLAAQKRLAVLDAAAALFAEWAAAQRGEMAAELVTAAPLKAADVKDAESRLSKAFGRKVNLAIREDASLMGGVIVKVGSQQLDSSLAGKIRRLKQSLKAA